MDLYQGIKENLEDETCNNFRSCIFVFYLIEKGYPLFEGQPIDQKPLTESLLNKKLKFDCIQYIYGEKAIRYKAVDLKYPSKFFRYINPKLREEMFDSYDEHEIRCVQCGSNKNIQLDHIHPFSHGGLTQKENLQILCKKCNLKKGNR